MHGENSELLPAASMAVAVANRSNGIILVKTRTNSELPPPSVKRFVVPTKCAPSPYPEPLQVGLVKNSKRNAAVGRLLNLPEILTIWLVSMVALQRSG